jgi:hypothetical protein
MVNAFSQEDEPSIGTQYKNRDREVKKKKGGIAAVTKLGAIQSYSERNKLLHPDAMYFPNLMTCLLFSLGINNIEEKVREAILSH